MSQLDQIPYGDRKADEEWQAPGHTTPVTHGADMNRISREHVDAENRIFSSGNWERFYEPTSRPGGVAIVPDKVRTWNRSGYTLAAQNSRGEKYVTPWNKEREQELTALGFKKNESMGVPYANELPTHPETRARWKKLLDHRDARDRMNEANKN